MDGGFPFPPGAGGTQRGRLDLRSSVRQLTLEVQINVSMEHFFSSFPILQKRTTETDRCSLFFMIIALQKAVGTAAARGTLLRIIETCRALSNGVLRPSCVEAVNYTRLKKGLLRLALVGCWKVGSFCLECDSPHSHGRN